MKLQIKKKYIVVIPARGGSKSIKFKNIQTFNGIPLISFAIKKFKKLGLNLEVIVTSDSDEILNLASKEGAYCIKRPIELSGDNATSESAITHVIKVYSEINKYKILNNKEKIRGPRQKRKPQIIETGGIYIFDRVEFENEGPRFLGNPLPIVIPKKESIDIDDPEDLRFANKIK